MTTGPIPLHPPATGAPRWKGRALDPAAEALLGRVRDSLGAMMPLAFVVTDPARDDNPIVYVNEAFEEITGYPADEVLGRNCRFLQGPGRADPARDDLRRAIAGREPITVEIRNRRRDGSAFLNRLMVAPLFGERGSLLAYLGIQYEVGPGDG